MFCVSAQTDVDNISIFAPRPPRASSPDSYPPPAPPRTTPPRLNLRTLKENDTNLLCIIRKIYDNFKLKIYEDNFKLKPNLISYPSQIPDKKQARICNKNRYNFKNTSTSLARINIILLNQLKIKMLIRLVNYSNIVESRSHINIDIRTKKTLDSLEAKNRTNIIIARIANKQT